MPFFLSERNLIIIVQYHFQIIHEPLAWTIDAYAIHTVGQLLNSAIIFLPFSMDPASHPIILSSSVQTLRAQILTSLTDLLVPPKDAGTMASHQHFRAGFRQKRSNL